MLTEENSGEPQEPTERSASSSDRTPPPKRVGMLFLLEEKQFRFENIVFQSKRVPVQAVPTEKQLFVEEKPLSSESQQLDVRSYFQHRELHYFFS